MSKLKKEDRCQHCNYGREDHTANEGRCPVGVKRRGVHWQFHPTRIFKASHPTASGSGMGG